jgi:AcrR family transcriptional regulator
MTASPRIVNPARLEPRMLKPVRSGAQRAEQSRSIATRAALIAAARRHFATIGYAQCNTTAIADEAEMTRGALYHHFAGKEELFEAVYCAVLEELCRRVVEATRDMQGQTWRRVVAAVRLHLEITAGEHEIQQILLIDGPAVLGWRRWRELQADNLIKGWEETARLLMAQGVFKPRPIESLALIIVGALEAASQAIAHSPHPETTHREAADVVVALLNGLRCDSRSGAE